MSILYGKVRLYGDPGQTLTVTDGKGNTRTIQTTGTTFTDVALPAMEEYNIKNEKYGGDIILNVGDFKELNVPAWLPQYYEELKAGTKLTEAQWLAFVADDGIEYIIRKGEQEQFIGKKITLSNTAASSYTSWTIADFGHDNSGYTCDVINDNNVYNTTFGSSQVYSNSTVRSWLTGTYYNGLSSGVRNRLQTMSVVSDGTALSDKVKALSVTEVGGSHNYAPVEGTKYPIFTSSSDIGADSSRIRSGANTNSFWWLRTRRTGITDYVWLVISDGSINSFGYTNSYGVVPCLRFA